ncbi:MAG: class I adenylate-forming enzyme family protein, partial [Candidatus Heimdallarchaeota archaeon]
PIKINPEEDLALLPFTGGTTGKPKATMLTHYNITTNVIQALHWFLKPLEAGAKGKSAFLICVPIFHQYGHWVLHAAISWGLRAILMDARDIARIADIIKDTRPFGVFGVPTHYMELLGYELKRSQTLFFSGAAPLAPDISRKFKEKVGVPMAEGYGMTETSPCTHVDLSGVSKITGFMSAKGKEGSVGVPIPDTEVKLVDPDTGDEVDTGDPGEIWIRGPQVMKGYYPEPGKGLEPDGWLRTGDIAKMDDDGYFWIVDRMKDMVNVSGMKVYSQVIEEILYEHPAVRMAGVIGIPDPERPGSERVKAIIVPKDTQEVSEAEIIAFCKEKLPPYAVPREIDFRVDIPLTRILKMDKKRLREEELNKHHS